MSDERACSDSLAEREAEAAARRALTHNEAQGGWVLLAPERVFKADAIARRDHQALHRRGDGERDRRRSGEDLQRAARAHRADVTAMLRGLADKRLLELMSRSSPAPRARRDIDDALTRNALRGMSRRDAMLDGLEQD